MMRDRASFYKKKQQFLNNGLELNYDFTSDSWLGAMSTVAGNLNFLISNRDF